MPVPFILGGAAAAAGLFGVAKGAKAVSNNNEAKELLERAEIKFDEAKENLEYARRDTNISLESLGELKLNSWSDDLGRFVKLVEQVKNVEVSGEANTDDLLKRNLNMSAQDLVEMREMSLKAGEVVAGGVGALGAGALAGVASYGGAVMFASASTGTAIASLSGVAATNATLAWFGGGSLAAGGFGMAGGTAVLGGIVAGPILAVGGALYEAKSRENLAEAKQHYAEAKHAIAEMENAVVLMNGIESLSNQYYNVINEVKNRFTIILDRLEHEIEESKEQQKETFVYKFKNIFTKVMDKEPRIDYRILTEDQQRVIHKSYQFAQVLKMLLETPLLTKDGQIDNNAYEVIETIEEMKLITSN